MQATRKDITVILVGSGGDDDMLRHAALKIGPGGVIFSGFVQPIDLIKYYYAADIYIHCSEKEPHSLAISEAIYAGLPVIISSKCGSYGSYDDVQAGKNGFVYTCGDIEHLSKCVIKLVDNPGLCIKMGFESAIIGKLNQDSAHGKSLLQALNLLT